MRNLATPFINSIRAGVTTLAFCWQLALKDGRVLGFTTHDQPLVIDGVTYSAESGILPSAFQQDLSLNTDDAELKVLFDDDRISEQDLISGALTGAEYYYFLVNYEQLPSSLAANPAECLLLSYGSLGEYGADELGFNAAALSLIDRLAEKQPLQTSPVCRATLGDTRCKVNLAPFTHILSVVSCPDRRSLTLPSTFAKPDGYFRNGTLEFLDGQNNGAIVKIADYDNTTKLLTLYTPVFFPVLTGASVRAVAGCNKTIATCNDKFGNVVNFRGEPHLPGQDVWVSGDPTPAPDEQEDL